MKTHDLKKITKSHIVKLNALPQIIFPFFCPVREEEWLVGWEHETYELIYSDSGLNEEGCIFKTNYPDGNESLWICTKYDKDNYEVEFLVHIKDLIIRKWNLLLKANAENTTDARFEFTVTAISEKGNAVVDHTEKQVVETASRIEMLLNHYIQNGTKLKG